MTSMKSFPRTFTKVDKLTSRSHSYLSSDDECYYLGEYAARRGYRYSQTNDLLLNFKKSRDREGRPEWRHKGLAIKQVAKNFSYGLAGLSHELDNHLMFGRNCGVVYVPVPPSKTKSDPLYDNRLPDMLNQVVCPPDFANPVDKRLDVQELIQRRESTIPAHSRSAQGLSRQTAQEIVDDHYLAVPSELINPRIISIVDDLLAEGAHYSACRSMLSERFPNSRIIGLFIARRLIEGDDLPW